MRRSRERAAALTAAAAGTYTLNALGVYNLLNARFYEAALVAPFVAGAEGWASGLGAGPLESFARSEGMALSRVSMGGFTTWLLEDARSGRALYLSVESDGSWFALSSGSASAAVDEALARLCRILPAGQRQEGSIAVRFWALGPFGPESYRRELDALAWEEAQGNYPAAVRAPLKSLMALPAPSAAGRLLLWHGPPGTGKTWALRALAAAWQSWCEVDYIVDADEFFGSAAYMVRALISGEEPEDGHWRLVVIEDAGEFLAVDAQQRTGQGLSRLLNLTDGLVGQGLRLLVLMTTNEAIEELHPAVSRPGRCMAEVAFPLFSPAEAEAWLRGHGVARRPDEAQTLAQLYALAAG